VASTTGDLSIDGSKFTGNAGSALRLGCGGRKAFVTETTFSGNQAPEGAAINATGCALFGIDGSNFSDNVATARGGAILARTTTLDLTTTTFDGNTSGSEGGAFYLEHVDLFATAVELTGNAAVSGGAIYADTCWLQISQGLLSANTATDTGGAVFVHGDSTEVKFTDSDLSLNTAADAAVLFRSTDVSQLILDDGVVTTEFTGVTMAGNAGTGRGSIDSVGLLSIVNSIVWANEPRDLELDDNDTLVLASSNVSGTAPDLSFVDPRFVDGVSDRRLSSDSPCIDTASDDTASPADLLDHARKDVPNVPSCPSDQPDCGSAADMGAYEYGY
jgi:predicted outer membrane repeat protein